MATITNKQDQAEEVEFWKTELLKANKKGSVKRAIYCRGMIDGLSYFAF
jgi:hypothetical protein